MYYLHNAFKVIKLFKKIIFPPNIKFIAALSTSLFHLAAEPSYPHC